FVFTLLAMGFPIEMFTVLFALGRVAGWLAHWEELMSDPEKRIARPRQIYAGPGEQEFLSLDERLSKARAEVT
ncbi:MAG: citrate (Si)-synthase, partial [Acidobacteriia bacterium]|nr:citrate (Si)-synthase [Terriglobia bacterium]